jgi:hypothetical protein
VLTALIGLFDLGHFVSHQRVVSHFNPSHLVYCEGRIELRSQTFFDKDFLLFFFVVAQLREEMGILGKLLLGVLSQFFEDCDLLNIRFCFQ